jgi:phage shock protein PspC (stress-responsive transcriptional regulator)
MKKTIQINIAGIVFNIEEDAYEKLSAYLRSIQQYFSNFEGSEEITSDIEARIAEKFINKQKTENQAVITIDGVNTLIKDMGTVADFEAVQEEEDLKQSAVGNEQSTVGSQQSTVGSQQSASSDSQPLSRFFRDTRRKALGGVLAGLAYHWKADIVWIRIAFLVIFFGLIPTGAIPGMLFLAYFIGWIILPPNANLEDNPNIKKYYRDVDNRVIGGVSSGLSSYFKTDIVVFRLIFVVLTITGGVGILLYLILWFVAPTARTLTQKMEMKGEALTIENIESKIKENKNPVPERDENTLSKIILFPFRLIGIILRGIGKVLGGLGPIVRVFIGLILLLISASLMIGFITSMVVFLGFVQGDGFNWGTNGNLDWILQDIHPAMGIFVFLAGFIPIIAMGMLGLILITGRTNMFNRGTWTGFLTAWAVGVVGTIVLAARYQINLSRYNKVEQVKNFPLPAQTLWLDAENYDDIEDRNDLRFRSDVEAELIGYEGSDLKLEQTFEARGRTKEEAKKNAEAIVYTIVQKDSALIFNEYLTLPPKGRFRDQDLKMKLYIPYNKRFKMTEDFYYGLYNHSWKNRHNYDLDVDGDDIDKYNFVMKRDSGIVCLDCPKLTNEERESRNNHYDDDDSDSGYIDYDDFNRNGQFNKSFDLSGFESVQAGGEFIINIKKGDKFSIKAETDEDDLLNNLELKVKDNSLKIDFEDHFRNNHSDVILNITMPNFKALNLSGKSQTKIIGFDDNKDVDIQLTGSSRAAIDIEANTIDLEIDGVSKAELRGKAQKIDLNLNGESRLDARKMQVVSANINANGDSKAKFGKVEKSFNSNTNGASKVTRE